MKRYLFYRFKIAMTIESNKGNEGNDSPAPNSEMLDADAVRERLRRVIDPEVGVNIVDLGLVYRIDVNPQGVLIELTMTSPACPMGDMIIDDAHTELAAVLPEGSVVEILLVWEPPWHPSMMNETSRLNLGWLD
ncbi:MAG: metal-sulfur cluster assembly factor [Rhodocyclaceae bacterium]